MPHDQLDNLVRVGKLKTEPATEREVAGLIKSGRARLIDSKIIALNIWQCVEKHDGRRTGAQGGSGFSRDSSVYRG